MQTLILLLIICAVVAVLLWLIDQIDFGPAILKNLLMFIVILVAFVKVLSML